MDFVQPSIKLKHLRLTLSKYDAKYSKTSTVFDDDDTSDDADVVTSGLNTRPPLASQTLSLHQYDYDTDIKNNSIQASKGEEVILHSTVVAEVEEQTSDETLSSKSFPFKSKDSKQNSASSLVSIETDSEIAFNNVHSFSSLAESILPLEEEMKLDSTASAIKTRSQVPTSYMPRVSVSSSSEESQREEEKRTADVPFNTFAGNTALRASASISIEVEALSSSKKEEESQNKCGRSFVLHESTISNKESTENLSVFEKTSSTSSKKKIGVLKRVDKSTYCDSADNAKVSIGTQTLCFEDITNRINSMRLVSAAVATPKIKPLQLPSYLRGDSGSSQNIAQLNSKGENVTVENEVEKLVSFHLDLVKEFLERQHRIYAANCKAVKLLERGYKETNIHPTLKVKLNGPESSEEGTRNVH